MRDIKKISSNFNNGNELGFNITMAILKEMLTQHPDKSWLLDISCRESDYVVTDYALTVLWSDGEFTGESLNNDPKTDTVLIMNYFKFNPGNDKGSTELLCTKYNLEVKIKAERGHATDAIALSFINECYRNIQKTVEAIVAVDKNHAFGNGNLPSV